MDDDSCVMKLIEIVPLTNSTDSPELPDINRAVQVKVCNFTLTLLVWNLETPLWLKCCLTSAYRLYISVLQPTTSER